MFGEFGSQPYHGETLSLQHRPSSESTETEPDDEEGNLVVDFDRLITEKRLLESQPTMTEGEINERLSALKENGELDTVYRRILDRIKQETNYLHEFEQLGLLNAILEHALDKKTLAGVNVNWEDSSILRRGRYRKGARGVFQQIINTAATKYPVPTKEKIIHDIGSKGYLPRGLRVMGHEIVHARQELNFEDIQSSLKLIAHRFSTRRASGELQEVHANRDANSPPQKKTKIKLIEKLSDAGGRKLYRGFEMDKLIYAVQAIDQLNALGLGPEEIAKLIRPGLFSLDKGWSKEQAIYPHIQKRIDAEAKKLGLDEYDLENLVQADKLEREIEQLRVKQIVREELANSVN